MQKKEMTIKDVVNECKKRAYDGDNILFSSIFSCSDCKKPIFSSMGDSVYKDAITKEAVCPECMIHCVSCKETYSFSNISQNPKEPLCFSCFNSAQGGLENYLKMLLTSVNKKASDFSLEEILSLYSKKSKISITQDKRDKITSAYSLLLH